MTIGLLGFQTTIAAPVSLTGIGVHSGSPVSITFQPAEANSGIIFARQFDDGSSAEYRAVSSQVGPTDLCTILGSSPATWVATIEHVMAALYALGIDNVTVDVDGAEMPIMDGSSYPFIDAIEQVGIVNLNVKRRYIRVIKPVRIESGASWSEFRPHDGTRFEVEIDFASPLIGRQSWNGELTAARFKQDLSRARTFGFMRDVERLWAAGYALGSSLENSVVISDDETVVNVEGLRYQDEFVRHKTLDAVGDLALAGAQFIGCYRSYRGGHKMNANALKALLNDPTAYEIVEAPSSRVARVRAGDFVPVSVSELAPSFA
ncbi:MULTISPECIES: UDP-3-O-acyl-N-acetylglucosamine deacetylase [Rhizobium/Agrobacterium group]|jgi:UDP-3-O-[3-hydroxymyristoyl] N-acetylglucosamine deacetylase|uniref:UDP-3-O-acyl-N-acetylglucosamine deacetylase n=1 Tax=Rhizobium soli TaxID=424798 RepID=A0A7X0JGP5_9HYPH|nr:MULTISPECIES: UDP-3-O-acyl-N-acetylglucosamine deacetylase [Rhizobium/Agrobacterium group]RYE66948.1 MAG: UDP-3-O-acyl-N-acetylglucosamine deacetylase [Rhizobiaceae bacterium]MBB6506940.1 UDP-3-O-[3-hydroxymyristoyl] N-acetylglucosamine deacetylase [Rhizobium soli]MBP2461528.1 UDP-3-O-[3-hydroxymyristoyl] N-acetylglucosamine deacetylase [Rhizobium sp. PvP014]MBP2528923.1 UDP-3-O-[3-hydroxymyristoyl] N-acetylglucosamine deacetylase [Rhizobium sp. PvP099]NSY17820.1 UDP-3-O-acyl-N-acetylglucos